MRGFSKALMGAALSLSASAAALAVAHAATGRADDEAAIRATMMRYQDALNAADTARVLPLYEPDGVFMQPYGPSVVGSNAIRETYDGDFSLFRLQVRFDIVEIVRTGPRWAFVRTTSAGTHTVNATHHVSSEGNQELFILHRQPSGAWLIARYSFSPTKPPSAAG